MKKFTERKFATSLDSAKALFYHVYAIFLDRILLIVCFLSTGLQRRQSTKFAAIFLFFLLKKEELIAHSLWTFFCVFDTCSPGIPITVASNGRTRLSMRRYVRAQTVAPLADANFVFCAHAAVHKSSTNKRLFKQGEAHRSLPLPPCFPISLVLPAVFSKHIPVGKQPPGGLGLSQGAYICLAGICLWIRNHLMHITPDKQGRMEAAALFGTNTSPVQLLSFRETPAGSHFACDCSAVLPKATNIIRRKRVWGFQFGWCGSGG